MSVDRALVLLGGGGHASVAADVARAAGWTITGFFDDDPSRALPGLAHLGSIDQFGAWANSVNITIKVHAAVGEADRRAMWYDVARDWAHPALIHPSAVVSDSACIAPGVLIGPNAVVNARSEVGTGVIINTGAIVEHDNRIGGFAHIAPRAVLGGNVTVGERTLIGLGAVVRPGVTLGRRVTIAAGAVVVDDWPDGETVVGVPARPRPETSRTPR